MKRMLINATQEEELRMAMVDGQRLYDLNIEAPARERKKANIYKGKITRIEPSLEAAFIDYGADRHGFLPLKEISSEYFVSNAKSGGKPSIKDVLKEGQDIVVQVDKEERGNKGAALTTFVSLAGRFIVLKPNKERSGGVSRRIVGDDRDLARQSLNEITIPDGMSVILRTAGIGRSAEELAWDLENLLTIWTAILNVVLERPSPFLIYRESNSVVRALRDYLTGEIGEILIDDEATYKDAHEFVEQVMPQNLKKLKHYVDPVPLFTRFQIESQIESAFAHKVTLPSGGSIVIDHTEAMVSIDVNSARATKGGDIEATALNINLEAAEEVARQLRIRDLGGLIVIDFIDMGPQKNQRSVESRLREAVRQDRARVQIGKISRFGLLEMSRQRLRPSIGESAYQTCPRCSGFGTIRSVESLALAILRIVGEEARKERTAKVIAQLPVEVATYLLNEKRDWVQNLESRNDIQVVLVANSRLETPHYEVRRVRDDQIELTENAGVSYALAHTIVEPETPQAILERKAIEQPVVGVMKPTKSAPKRPPPESKGLWARLTAFFTADDEEQPSKPKRSKTSGGSRTRRAPQSRRRNESRQKADKRSPQRKKITKKKTTKKAATKKKTTRKSAAKKKSTSDAQQKPADSKAQQETADESRNEPKRSSRNRRSRGGRRRRRTADKPERSAENQQPTAESGQSADPEQDSKVKQQAQRPSSASAGSASDQKPERDSGSGQPARKPQSAGADSRSSQKPDRDSSGEQPTPKPQSAGTEPSSPKKPTQDSGSEQPAPRAQPVAAAAQPPQKPERSGAGPKPGKQSEPAGAESKPGQTPEPADRSPRPADKPPAASGDRQPATPPRDPQVAKHEENAAQKSRGSKKASDTAPPSKPAGDGNGASAKPASRLLPWEPQPAADLKPPSKSEPPKPAPNPTPAPKAETRPDEKPAEPAQD